MRCQRDSKRCYTRCIFWGCQLKCLCIIFLVCEPIHFFIEYVGAPQIGSHLYILVSDFCMAFVQEVSTQFSENKFYCSKGISEQVFCFCWRKTVFKRKGILMILMCDTLKWFLINLFRGNCKC